MKNRVLKEIPVGYCPPGFRGSFQAPHGSRILSVISPDEGLVFVMNCPDGADVQEALYRFAVLSDGDPIPDALDMVYVGTTILYLYPVINSTVEIELSAQMYRENTRGLTCSVFVDGGTV